MRNYLRGAKHASLSVARSVGLFDAVGNSAWRKSHLMVLCYHGVSVSNEHDWSDLYVSQERLRKRMQFLRKLRANVLPLGEALQLQERGELPDRAVAITFDDGAADFSTRAYPVLKEFDIPTMLYQTTWYVDKEYPVFNTTLSYVLWNTVGKTVSLPSRKGPEVIPPYGSEAFSALRSEFTDRIHRDNVDGEAQTELLKEIAKACGYSLDKLIADRQLFVMSGAQIRELDSGLIDIQLHTHRHRTPRDRTLFLRELQDNTTALQRILNSDRSFTHFCYPSGVYFPEFADWLREYGVESSTTCDPGITSRVTDRMFVPRLIDTMHTPDVVFEGWVTGAASFYPQRR